MSGSPRNFVPSDCMTESIMEYTLKFIRLVTKSRIISGQAQKISDLDQYSPIGNLAPEESAHVGLRANHSGAAASQI